MCCIGAIVGPMSQQMCLMIGPFENQKGTLSQNVKGACGFDGNFCYVFLGCEVSASDVGAL